jgi:hypothetical protein
MRPRNARFVAQRTRPRQWWVVWGRRPVTVAGPYRLRRSARYVAGLLNEDLEREPLER